LCPYLIIIKNTDMSDEYALVTISDGEVSRSTIRNMLDIIRPVWKGKGLIKRVERLLPVDPSSACQRLLNAAIVDVREKIITIGIDIAKEVAKAYNLPPIEKEDDIMENYSTYNIIDLSYRIGILRRSEWRRIQRCYEIRRDLEHEDNEYEAVLEDCFYIFKSTIEVVLSQDPIELLRVKDVKQIVEEALRITVSEELLQNYDHAPELRQKEIILFLISTIKNSGQPDIVRENAIELLRHFKSKTKTQVVIASASILEEKLKGSIDLITAKIGHAIGATSYFKKVKVKDYYNTILDMFSKAGNYWERQTKATYLFHDVGHFSYCPKELIPKFLKYLVEWYIGEPGGYGDWGQNRAVFYSDAAAPIIARIVKYTELDLYKDIDKLRKDTYIKRYLSNKHILNRFEELLDLAERN
jgi:hypothetical protein